MKTKKKFLMILVLTPLVVLVTCFTIYEAIMPPRYLDNRLLLDTQCIEIYDDLKNERKTISDKNIITAITKNLHFKRTGSIASSKGTWDYLITFTTSNDKYPMEMNDFKFGEITFPQYSDQSTYSITLDPTVSRLLFSWIKDKNIDWKYLESTK